MILYGRHKYDHRERKWSPLNMMHVSVSFLVEWFRHYLNEFTSVFSFSLCASL